MIREAQKDDLQELLRLYLFLHEKAVPENTQHLRDVWEQIMADPNHHIIVAEEGMLSPASSTEERGWRAHACSMQRGLRSNADAIK